MNPPCAYGRTGPSAAVPEKRCADKPVRGSQYCTTHRAEAMLRVQGALNPRAAMLTGLRWGGTIWSRAERKW